MNKPDRVRNLKPRWHRLLLCVVSGWPFITLFFLMQWDKPASEWWESMKWNWNVMMLPDEYLGAFLDDLEKMIDDNNRTKETDPEVAGAPSAT